MFYIHIFFGKKKTIINVLKKSFVAALITKYNIIIINPSPLDKRDIQFEIKLWVFVHIRLVRTLTRCQDDVKSCSVYPHLSII